MALSILLAGELGIAKALRHSAFGQIEQHRQSHRSSSNTTQANQAIQPSYTSYLCNLCNYNRVFCPELLFISETERGAKGRCPPTTGNQLSITTGGWLNPSRQKQHDQSACLMKGLLRPKTAFWRLERLPGRQNQKIFQYSTGHAYAHKRAIKPPNTQDINLHTSRTRPAEQLPSCRHSNLQNCAGLKRQRLALCMAQNRWAGVPKQNPPAKSPIYRQLGEGFGRRFAR